MINRLVSAAQSGNPISSADIQATLSAPGDQYGYGHASWGVGEFGDVSSGYENATKQLQQDLINRIAIEGSDASLTAQQRQQAGNDQEARKQALDALQAGSSRSEGMWNRVVSELNPLGEGKETIQQAYERLTGRKIT